jgi:hypothetical protein
MRLFHLVEWKGVERPHALGRMSGDKRHADEGDGERGPRER